MQREDFCYPSDFFAVDKNGFIKSWNRNKIKTIVVLLFYLSVATICFIGYNIFFPFRIIHEWCENFCYK